MNHQVFHCLENQQRFLYSEKASGTRSLLPVSFQIKGRLDAERLSIALEQVVSLREMTRARLVFQSADHCTLEVSAARRPAVSRHDLSALNPSEQKIALKAIVSETMDCHDGYFCAVLVRLGPKRFSLTLVPHHAVVDGISIGILLSEISALYNAPQSGLTSDSNRYAEAIQTIESREANSRDADIVFWREQLANLASQPGIPSARRAGQGAHDTGHITEPISPALHEKARALAKGLGIRTFSLYLGLGQIVLQRLTGENDLAVSIQSAGRRSFGIDDQLVGLFSRALIIRARGDSDHHLADRLREVDTRVSVALNHEGLPYHHAIGLAGTAPRYAFNWYPVYRGLDLEDCLCEEEVICPWPTTFDLNFHFIKRASELELRVFFDCDACDKATATLAARNLLHLLEAAPESTMHPVQALASPCAYPLGQAAPVRQALGTIDADFRSQAEATPDSIAISHAKGTLSYRELHCQTAHLAGLISDLALQTPRVAVIGHRGAGLAIGALAALEAGGSFALIDPCYPDARIRGMIDILNPDVIVICKELLVDIPNMGFETNTLEINGADAVFAIRKLLHRATSRDIADHEELAYWLFTSGSTGKPKCISTDHAPLLKALKWQATSFDLDAEDRVSFLSGVSHDPALRDLFLPLLLGGCVCTPDPTRLFDPGYLHGWIREQAVTVAHLTPAMIRLIETGAPPGETCNTLKTIFLGGDRIGPDLVEYLRDLAPDARLFNVYGASETPQIVLFREFERNTIFNHAIGRPRPDVSARIVDGSNRICGLREPGEIVIETAYLSNGYLQPETDPEAASAFTGSLRGQGCYRTGDLGYISETDEIVLIGRLDDQVKIRGYRVELDEVTVHLQAAAGTSAATVTARVDDTGATQLVAFLERCADLPDERTLLAALADRVPSHMVPSHLIVLERFPLLPNGKIDRQALADVPLRSPAERDDYVAPQTAEEKRLVAAWEAILGFSPIGVTDSFFSLGGDSLTGVRLMLEMERAGLNEQAARAILQGATIRDLTQSRHGAGDHEVNAAPIPPGPLLSRMSVHGLRGLLVILIVAGHWFPGLIARVPALAGLGHALTPLFNLSTPGFAIMFGMSLGYFNYETYLTRPVLYWRQIIYGLSILAVALAILAALRLSGMALNSVPITQHELFISFYNVLGFYFLAVASTPLWFTWISRMGHIVPAIGMLLLVYIALDLGLRWALLRYEPQGLVQLLRLYATAKFSYFNMSAGALLGLAVGDVIRRNPDLPSQFRFILAGPVLISIGLLWGWFLGETDQLISASNRISYWKWCLYFGVILCAYAALSPLMSHFGGMPGWRGGPLKLLGAIGILALPFFIFHGLILDIKGLLDALSVPDLIGVALVLGLFFGVGAIAVRRIWRLYFL